MNVTYFHPGSMVLKIKAKKQQKFTEKFILTMHKSVLKLLFTRFFMFYHIKVIYIDQCV